MIKNLFKNFVFFELTFYSYHRFIHNFDFHINHHKFPNSDEKLLYASIISGTTYSTLGYVTNNFKPTMFYWGIATIIHPIIHKYNIKQWPLSYIQERHEQHHLNPNTKFGPVTPLCDIFFGTEYD
jgi:hypothetical protein